MHDAVMRWVGDQVNRFDLYDVRCVLDLGGRDVNGTTERIFAESVDYVTVDIAEHPSVDVVADAAEVELGREFDVVVSTEVFEHTPKGRDITANAYRHLKPGGVFIATMAGPGRPPHSAGGAPLPEDWEWYENVPAETLEEWVRSAGFREWEVDTLGTDVRCWARK